MTDPKTVRLVAGFAGLIVLAVVIGGFVLAFSDRDLPDVLVGLGGTALGGLLGLLVPAGGRQEVVVRQPADEPVPTTDVGAISAVEAAVLVLILVAILVLLGVLPD